MIRRGNTYPSARLLARIAELLRARCQARPLACVRMSAVALAQTVVAPMLVMLLAGSCSVYEWPDESTPAQLEMRLVFEGEMTEYKEVDYGTRSTESSLTSDELDIRYTFRFYPALPGGGYSDREAPDYTAVLSRPASEGLDCSFRVSLPEGKWQVRCWTDYVRKGSVEDLFYEASDFAEITLPEDYLANTDYKDAFMGSAEVSLRRVGQKQAPMSVSLEMERPLAKFRFVATDFDQLVTKVVREQKSVAAAVSSSSVAATPAETFDPKDYSVRFRYTSFLPSVFDMFKDKPVDSRTGVSFDSELIPLSETEVLMGFDYVMVNGHESDVYVEVSLYDSETGNLLSSTTALPVPLVRGKVTTVNVALLTMDTGGGITVNPAFEDDKDEFIIHIP